MNSLVKKTVAIIMIIAMLCYTMPVFAVTNDETIYSKLNSNGEKYKSIVSTNKDGNVEQSETDKDLPVDCEVKYKLNGEEISAQELAGKSGNVEITLKYKNKSEKQVNINGKTETMYTPFVVVSGTIIDNENNKNIEITNGKVIENGNKTIVFGMAMPGLQESLNISSEFDIDIPSEIKISMETTNFEMKNINYVYTICCSFWNNY